MNMSDEEFLAAFLECRLPASAFDHRGHLRIAWLLLKRYPLEQAIEAICGGIARLAAHFGVPDKYNRTLSEALVRLMAHDDSYATSLEAFLDANSRLLTDVGGLLARHYSPERLNSAAAKASFVQPDRLPLTACHA
jgi:hypothetical protein